jgi:aminoglycoside 3-N-acetyltransferase I
MADVRRLRSGEETVALDMFRMMAAVFAEDDEDALDADPLREEDVSALLRREEFWAVVATENDEVVAGLTAHALPMTRSRSTELFIYDLAVRADWQRRGIGRTLVAELLSLSRESGLGTAFVPADNDDQHALEFYRAIGGTPSPVTFFTFSR